MKVKDAILSLCMILTATAVQAQIIIGGNVYGGGNEGDTGGNTNVTVYGGDINRVFGGARMANVGGRAFVHLDAEHSSSPYTLINYVFGGNDISGIIGQSSAKTRPTELTKDDENGIDNSWDAFVRVSSKMTPVYYTQEEADAYNTENNLTPADEGFVTTTTVKTAVLASDNQKIYVGQLFGGGNGDYTYNTTTNSAGKYEVKSKDGTEILGTSTKVFEKPELNRTYLEILGGSMVYAFGGGNNATVTDDAVICVDNPSEVVYSIVDRTNKNADPTTGELLTTERTTQDMALNAVTTYATSDAFQIGSFFGGNNKVEMKIQPVWHLNSGKIRNIYSGGNEGDMTCPIGLLLEIPVTSSIIVDNIYGGCRKANVHPLDDNGAEVPSNSIQLEDEDYKFPSGLSARVLVSGGDINNVYGGNDISGRVWGGTAVGIYTSIRGDVYGGGNGSYAYTDNSELKDDPTWGDFYYAVPADKTSVEALNEHRPNVEQISLRLSGTDADHLTIIGGSVYVGGNSATVVKNDKITNPMVELKIGSYVIADKVFLGNNGEEMIQTDVADEDNHIREGVLRTYAGNVKNAQGVSKDFSTINLNDPATMYEYMNGCAMSLRPTIVFDKKNDDGTGDSETYIPYSSAIGSLYCGGNVGSMIWEGTATFDVEHAIVIYDKFVAGCNNSYVPYHEGLNAVYWGGVVGTEDEQKPGGMENTDGSIKDAIVLNLSGLKIQPMRWVTKRDGSYVPILSADGKPIYMANCEHDCELSTINAVCEHGKQVYMEWNTFDVSTGLDVANPAELATGTKRNSTDDDINRRLKGGNIYGGCYTAGVVNGNVVINVNETIMDRDDVFANVEEDELGEGIYYETNEYHITKVNSGVIIDEQGMDVLGKAMNIFGGGFGKDTEIWGSTTINLNEGYVFQIFGGAEEGVIGKPEIDSGDESDEVEFPLIYTTTTLADGTYDATTGLYAFNGYLYKADERYSTHINLDGGQSGVSRHSADDSNKMAETEFIYGGAFEGPIMGNAIIHLGNGRIFNSFAGSCNADIMGHTETYVGLNASGEQGFPWIRDHIYGGNDLGGRILGSKDFMGRVREDVTGIKNKIYGEDCTKAAAYIEYQQGRVDYIFGGCYGTYDYSNSLFSAYTDEDGKDKPGFTKPRLGNAFVNFRPIVSNNPNNKAKRIYGAGQGIPITTNNNKGLNFGMDIMQDRSYVLIDIPAESTEFHDLVVFGAGKNGGLGMGIAAATAKADPDAVSAVIDLFRGNISGGNVYGGSDVEGVTRRTVVNVPDISTIRVKNIFGGAYGSSNDVPCDVYEATVNYSSPTAMVGGYRTGIYGGNNAYRRTVHSIVNINAPTWSDIEGGQLATVFGAGLGENTWSQYTEVNLNNSARVYEVYGGGSEGRVLNLESVKIWKNEEPTLFTTIGDGYDDWALDTDLAKANGLGIRCNANVYINKGANVSGYIYNGSLSGGYAFGAGYGAAATVSGTTYIGLHGGYVAKDIYGSGSSGSVFDEYKRERDTYNSIATAENKVSDFTAGTNVFVEGGKVRRAYGGGYQGNVGYTELPFTVTDESSVATLLLNDADATTNVVIGIPDTQKETINAAHTADATQPEYGFYKGVPTVEWNAYGGGEKGGVIGTAHLTMYNGYVGYRYLGSDAVITGSDVAQTDDSATPIDERYIEKLDDETASNGGQNNLLEHGNLFGSGFDDGSYVDNTEVSVYGGYIRNSVYGGGEIAAVGRGETKESGTDNTMRDLKGIWKGGSTKVSIFSGHVLQNVFGGGKGFTAERGEEYGLSTVRRYTDGYVFGKTEANIHGGEIGTEEGIARGYGNVFGGGNVGYVYSSIGKKNDADGFYYQYDENDEFVLDNGEKILTEGTKVMISPYCRVTNPNGVEVNGHAYAYGDFVPTEDLNTLPYKDVSECPEWGSMDTNTGIVIHNAVFAGGNVTQGSDLLYAQATTVYGNATASLVDVFCRDLITLGEDGVGGLYGDGNLTFVDGYRELNITNFGTDYYGLSQTLEYEDYLKLNDRERAYFKLQYKCITPYGDFKVDDVIDEEVYDRMSEADQVHWEVVQGVCSIYAGRMMNTIQRADFCGVFGSRLVMKGAQDRIPSEVDYINYTINRVGEVSLNQKRVGDQSHGNYFGIYNITKYLGSLTSDVKFASTRKVQTGSTISDDPDGLSYYQYKLGKQGQRDRNIGHSENELAMASGVYLELLKEPSRNYVGDEKIWGPVTGVIGLKLIATSTGEGGGYVYAKNIHGTKTESDLKHLTISNTNQDAITQNSYTYAHSTADQWMESSGNFVIDSPSSIIDDCFPNTNSFTPEYGIEGGDDTSPAHYWYIHGYFYVYNQEISAYTGSSQAYTQTVNIPLTITAQGNGKLWIEDIKTNLYADASKFPLKAGSTTERETEVVCNGTTYRSNDPITYWDWSNLGTAEKAYFVETSYVCVMDVYESATATTPAHTAGEVLSGETAYNTYKNQTWYDENGQELAGTRAFRVTNGLSHEKGYELAVSLDNPAVWDEYFTDPVTGVTVAKGSEDTNDLLGPTYKLKGSTADSHVFGQKEYILGDLVEKPVVDNYNGLSAAAKNSIDTNAYPQAVFEPAYMALEDCYITVNGNQTVHVVKHGAIPESYYTQLTDKSNFTPAYILTNTVQLTDKQLISAGVLYTGDEKDGYISTYSDKVSATDFPMAYYCSTPGYYGGTEFSGGRSYQAVQYSGLSAAERNNFTYNYDALDIMLDDTFAGNIGTYDKDATNNPVYSKKQYVNYSVMYTGTASTLRTKTGGTFLVENNGTTTYTREEYESLLNEKQYYTPISLNFKGEASQSVYVVTTETGQGGRIYPVGTTLTATEYATLDDKTKVTLMTFNKGTGGDVQKFYYCGEAYTTKDAITTTTGSIAAGGTVAQGTILTESVYDDLPNDQVDFNVIAASPQEKSAFYVSSDCDIYDFSQDRIFTVIYRYSYTEKDAQGNSIESISERHVLNIRVHFESGEPSISELLTPAVILPGSTVGLNVPTVDDGAFTVLGGGWELYQNFNDAIAHKNGVPYTNNTTPMYWYQNDWYVAYYAETYLGRTYSNAVPFTIANYHDLDNVMSDTEHHMYVDHPDVKRNSKIYIDDRDCTSDDTKSELDLLKDFFDLSLQRPDKIQLTDENNQPVYDDNNQPVMIDNPTFKYQPAGWNKGHSALNDYVEGGANLEFILNSDVAPKKYTDWTPIGTADQDDTTGKFTNCFEGTLHGDGYTISGLNNSLFQSLCGAVYNLGVTGTFTSAGIVETGTGYIENCWIKSDDINAKTAKPLFNTPARNATMEGGKYANMLVQIVNSYYPEENNYTDHPDNATYGKATEKPLKSFYNGEVAYDLNGFYLAKRYADNTTSITTNPYKYFTVADNVNNTLSTTPSWGHYADKKAIYPITETSTGTQYSSYVESRYIDGDFIYAGGTIPTGVNERYYAADSHYYPIWPDDYIFFGQMLTYGYFESSRPYQTTPSHITKSDRAASDDKNGATGWLITGNNSNRVYRAPAYFRNSIMDVAHFNIYCMVPTASTEETGSLSAYPGMTAIDFTGYNDNSFVEDWADGLFNKKVLDFEGLTGFRSDGQTQNLLAYANESETNVTNILSSYFGDRAFNLSNVDYKTVAALTTAQLSGVKGHLVKKNSSSGYVTSSDHLLVDKQDFNAPISYTFGSGYRMWYQRTPDKFVDRTKGWEDISIPFKAELVTTQDKGEITHFYSGSYDYINDKTSENNGYVKGASDLDSKVGHEYWLREFTNITETTENEITTATAMMKYPTAIVTSTEEDDKEVTNNFLWEYYYSKNWQKDANSDIYQTYYNNPRTYKDYPLLAAGTPYIIGFPGSTYYEFDLSGTFTAQNTFTPAPTKLGKQTITFASPTGTTIEVSDGETGVSYDGASKKYSFVTNYLNQSFSAGTDTYTLYADGSKYERVPAAPEAGQDPVPDTKVSAFRPYFTSAVKTSGGARPVTRSIVFSNEETELKGVVERGNPGDEETGSLDIYAKKHKIIVESALTRDIDIRIVNAAGLTVSTFNLEPGETVETRIVNAGVYIVQSADGRYTKKLAVR